MLRAIQLLYYLPAARMYTLTPVAAHCLLIVRAPDDGL